jgi:3-hydroxyacyl-[acyl-carrier-protein] dehydratase
MTDNLYTTINVEDNENGFVAEIETNPSHIIYKAHFPGNPITPGVCIIKTAKELLENKINRKLWLKNVKNVKFLSVIIPAEGKRIKYAFSNVKEEENGCKVQVQVNDETTIYAKISLLFSYERI